MNASPPYDEGSLSEPPDPSSPRFGLRLLLAVAAAGAIAAGFHFAPRTLASNAPDGPPVAAPAKVTVAPVEQRTVAEHRELIGRVDARETVEIRPRVSGHIDEVRFQAGSVVEKGDVLFVIDPRPYRARVEQVAAEVERARVRLDIADREAERTERLLKSRAVSVEESETRTSRLAEARTELAAMSAALVAAELDLEHTEVRSPIRGTVSRAWVTAGNLVSSENLLTTVVSTGDVFVYADVDETTALAFDRLRREGRIGDPDGRIAVEMQVGDERDYPHRGHIESADNRVDPETGTLVYRMVFPNPDGALVPGLHARIRLPVGAPEPRLLVSERSIGTNQSQKFVLTVSPDNTVNYRTVKLGPVLQGKRVIREGLGPGDRVIVSGLQRVAAGMIVEPSMASN